MIVTLLLHSQTFAKQCVFSFFFNDTATTEIYTLSLHDALPIWLTAALFQIQSHRMIFSAMSDIQSRGWEITPMTLQDYLNGQQDRKSTRLNSSHANISYAVFCLKKKKSKLHQAVRATARDETDC